MSIITSLSGNTTQGTEWVLEFSTTYGAQVWFALVIDGDGQKPSHIVATREQASSRHELLKLVYQELDFLFEFGSENFEDALEHCPEILELPGNLQAQLSDLCADNWTVESVDDSQIDLVKKHSTDVEDVLIYRRKLKSWLINSMTGQFTGDTARAAIAADAEHTAEMLSPSYNGDNRW